MTINVVSVSGEHFYQESGAVVVVASGVGVTVQSGVYFASGIGVTVQSGVYLASGLYVVADIAESGMGVQVQSGLFIASGTIVTADLMTEDKLLLYQIANPPNLDKIVNATRTQQVSGVVTVTGGAITATLAATTLVSGSVYVNMSGIADIQGRLLPINMNSLAWAQVVRTRIT